VRWLKPRSAKSERLSQRLWGSDPGLSPVALRGRRFGPPNAKVREFCRYSRSLSTSHPGAWIGPSVEKELRRDHIADRPSRFSVERFDLCIAGVFWVGLDDGVSPETSVGRSFNIDTERCVADILAIDLDSSARRLRDDLNFQPRSYGLLVRCASGEEQKSGSQESRENGAKEGAGPIHKSCLIRKESGSSPILCCPTRNQRIASFPCRRSRGRPRPVRVKNLTLLFIRAVQLREIRDQGKSG
jgi:hypothetical protein